MVLTLIHNITRILFLFWRCFAQYGNAATQYLGLIRLVYYLNHTLSQLFTPPAGKQTPPPQGVKGGCLLHKILKTVDPTWVAPMGRRTI